jgi:hypothetical protein
VNEIASSILVAQLRDDAWGLGSPPNTDLFSASWFHRMSGVTARISIPIAMVSLSVFLVSLHRSVPLTKRSS